MSLGSGLTFFSLPDIFEAFEPFGWNLPLFRKFLLAQGVTIIVHPDGTEMVWAQSFQLAVAMLTQISPEALANPLPLADIPKPSIRAWKRALHSLLLARNLDFRPPGTQAERDFAAAVTAAVDRMAYTLVANIRRQEKRLHKEALKRAVEENIGDPEDALEATPAKKRSSNH